ncbi:hypothetical protein ACB094_03G053900 [Castanea mollissima]
MRMVITYNKTRVIWYGCKCNWSMRTGTLNMFSSTDIIKLVLDPPDQLHGDNPSLSSFSLNGTLKMALTLEAIWNLRNQVLHNREKLVNHIKVTSTRRIG